MIADAARNAYESASGGYLYRWRAAIAAAMFLTSSQVACAGWWATLGARSVIYSLSELADGVDYALGFIANIEHGFTRFGG